MGLSSVCYVLTKAATDPQGYRTFGVEKVKLSQQLTTMPLVIRDLQQLYDVEFIYRDWNEARTDVKLSIEKGIEEKNGNSVYFYRRDILLVHHSFNTVSLTVTALLPEPVVLVVAEEEAGKVRFEITDTRSKSFHSMCCTYSLMNIDRGCCIPILLLLSRLLLTPL